MIIFVKCLEELFYELYEKKGIIYFKEEVVAVLEF
jgi:hypothetical protein